MTMSFSRPNSAESNNLNVRFVADATHLLLDIQKGRAPSHPTGSGFNAFEVSPSSCGRVEGESSSPLTS
jgi:hypothetical protein